MIERRNRFQICTELSSAVEAIEEVNKLASEPLDNLLSFCQAGLANLQQPAINIEEVSEPESDQCLADHK